ncbi:MAG TPA: gfo/Idh/MocA family oxidoreductase [Chloroflexi bacterium]|nr:gfo/Idh/MocA family oxidoreductase [Chloroflexota bacterium]HHW88789.1 Gfo/Idh/MocA family oxidoreductase [Chloroflexota bacterium]
METPQKYALVGAGVRGLEMFARPLVERFSDHAQLVGVYDPNPVRARYVSDRCGGVAVFGDFDTMLVATHPDVVIVATIDRWHHDYILRSLAAGCDVLCEKPLAIDTEQVRAILAAEAHSGRKVTVTFNLRFAPLMVRVKELVQQGAIGRVLAVDLAWWLDRQHGADYFRRWHRRLENSGGLLVHKATHHFDLVNWWVDDEPAVVFANGQRLVYGPTRAERGVRCTGCPHHTHCEFAIDLNADSLLRSLYAEAEAVDGYWRDGCVFAEEIDIWDTMSVSVRYRGGALLTYALNAYSPYEGWRATLTGTAGRIEVGEALSGLPAQTPQQTLTVCDLRGEQVVHTLPKVEGGHGGSDARLQAELFGERRSDDPLHQMADAHAGARSVQIGAAANRSIRSGQPVEVELDE